MKLYRVVIKWVSGEHEIRYVNALNDIHAESIVMDSFNPIQLGLVDTVRAHIPGTPSNTEAYDNSI